MTISVTPRFRSDLRFSSGRPGIVIVDDPATGKQIELNEIDCLALRAMEGAADLDLCAEKARAVIPTATRAEVERLVRELSAYGILETSPAAAERESLPALPDVNAWVPEVPTVPKPRSHRRVILGAATIAAALVIARLIEIERTVDAPVTRVAGSPAEVLVAERDVPLVTIGAAVTVHTLLVGSAVNGRIAKRGTRVEEVNGRPVVRFATDIDDPSLLEGLTGSASISAGSEPLLHRVARWGRRVLFE